LSCCRQKFSLDGGEGWAGVLLSGLKKLYKQSAINKSRTPQGNVKSFNGQPEF
jgi:hypothetical protein